MIDNILQESELMDDLKELNNQYNGIKTVLLFIKLIMLGLLCGGLITFYFYSLNIGIIIISIFFLFLLIVVFFLKNYLKELKSKIEFTKQIILFEVQAQINEKVRYREMRKRATKIDENKNKD